MSVEHGPNSFKHPEIGDKQPATSGGLSPKLLNAAILSLGVLAQPLESQDDGPLPEPTTITTIPVSETAPSTTIVVPETKP